MARDEVLEGIRVSLSSTVGVRDAAYFGSTAREQVDALSDIDLVVQCDPETALRFVHRLHDVMEVVLYRPFTNEGWPEGRYWFLSASPFLRLDVSFYGRVEFHQLLAHGIGKKQPPFVAVPLEAEDAPVEPSGTFPRWTDMDLEFARALWRFHESAKAVARGCEPRHPIEDATRAVRRFESSEIRPRGWELYERSLSQLEMLGPTTVVQAIPDQGAQGLRPETRRW